MRRLGLFLIIISFSVTATFSQKGNTFVEINTSMGKIKVMLYDETPLHRDNFVKLVKKGFYNELLFHRVIKNFMIQGGDPNSRGAEYGKRLGNGGPGYTIKAEIKDGFFHKKGVLSAARLGDYSNPERNSSGSQFYIVQGQVYTSQQLAQMENSINNKKKQPVIQAYLKKPENAGLKNKIQELQKARNYQALNELIAELDVTLAEEYKSLDLFHFSEAQRKAYTTIGGTPHLDDQYTVFGEVVEGLDVIDKIAAVKTGTADRPEVDVKFSIKLVTK